MGNMLDPNMMGLPPGLPPMDPAAMGGAPPMDPAMAGLPPGMPPMDPAMMDPAAMGGLPPGPAPDDLMGADVPVLTEWEPMNGEITSPIQCQDIGANAVVENGKKFCTLLPPDQHKNSWKPLDPMGGTMGESDSSKVKSDDKSSKKSEDKESK